ncbi:MAG: tyrosine-type recombinase/integrase [Terriglobia bacterium]
MLNQLISMYQFPLNLQAHRTQSEVELYSLIGLAHIAQNAMYAPPHHSVARFIQPFFSHYLPEQRGLSPHSILAYRDAIKLLLGYAADTLKKKVDALEVEDFDASRVLAFLDSLESQRGSRPATRNARLAALRSFFGYVAREEPSLIPQAQTLRAIPLKRTEHPSIGYLEEREIQSLLNAVNVRSRTGIRDRALLLLFYNTGARVSEIVHLKITHLRLDGTPQVQLLGKGKKHRSCPLWPETVNERGRIFAIYNWDWA